MLAICSVLYNISFLFLPFVIGFFFLWLYLFFNWRIIALKNFVVFCQIAIWISHVFHSVMSDSLWPHGLQQDRPSCPSPSSGVCSNSCPLSQWCYSAVSSSVTPFSSCPQSFQHQSLFQWISSSYQKWPKYWSFSFRIGPSDDYQCWFPLGLTGLISLQSKGLSRDFSNTTIYPLALSLLYGPTLTSIHDSWKNHSFDYTHLCRQSDVSAF